MKLTRFLLTITFGTILLSCSSSKSTSILYSNNYDKDKDQTSVMMLPYGQIKIPGKWTNTKDNYVSGQHFFIGQDSVTIAIALTPWNKFEFSHKNPSIKTDNFLKEFYNWDANYLKEKSGGQLRIVKEDKDKNYLIWNLKSGSTLNDYYLFGLKGQIAYNLNVTTEMWDEAKKVKFLEELYGE